MSAGPSHLVQILLPKETGKGEPIAKDWFENFLKELTDRAYRVSGYDHFEGRPFDLDCVGDAEAIEAAKQFVDGCDVELWKGTRMVARIAVSQRPQ